LEKKLFFAVLVELAEEEVEGFQSEEYKQRTDSGQHIHATSTSQADGGCHPKARSCRQSADHILLFTEDDGTSTDETDAADHLRGYTRHIPSRGHPVHLDTAESVGRHNHKQCRAQCHEEMRAETSLLGTVFAFEPDETAKQCGNENS